MAALIPFRSTVETNNKNQITIYQNIKCVSIGHQTFK